MRRMRSSNFVVRMPSSERGERACEAADADPATGMPRDVANAVLFLAAQSSGFTTGEVIHVSGGRFASM